MDSLQFSIYLLEIDIIRRSAALAENSDNSDHALSSQKVPAAAYVRMSTEHQRYSIDNQFDAIEKYALKHGMEIVQTFKDHGKSGLKIAGREGLKELLNRVEIGDSSFDVILVYDISRWGRFQDADESAHYEYVCRRSGYAVHYCAEQFRNDGSLPSELYKSIKRSMAGEYSRELSTKVFAGQCRLIQLGFRQGGPAGFGLRRMLVDERGNEKGILAPGEHKSLQTDRVILVPGPKQEVDLVQRIYSLFINDGCTESEIADHLNNQDPGNILYDRWSRSKVHEILTNEKYIGNNVYNRRSFKLKIRRVANKPEDWIRATGVFESIVDSAVFHTAQGIIRERSRRYSDQEMIDRLKSLYQKRGFLSGFIIDETDNIPSSGAYGHRFGSLLRAYTLVGYTPDRDYRYIEINRRLRHYHSGVVTQIAQEISQLGGDVVVDPATDILTISNEFTASISIARHLQTQAGSSRWNLRFETSLRPDLTIGVRMNQDNDAAMDYYLLPSIDVCRSSLRLAEANNLIFDAYKYPDLSFLFEMAERCHISEVA